MLLQQLEKEKELLRIFLKVSQMENTLLRRMNLHSFLMVRLNHSVKVAVSREELKGTKSKLGSIYLPHAGFKEYISIIGIFLVMDLHFMIKLTLHFTSQQPKKIFRTVPYKVYLLLFQVPVQRVTKYPLLLARLYKATPPTHASREDCRRAKEKIELHLQHMNNVSQINN